MYWACETNFEFGKVAAVLMLLNGPVLSNSREGLYKVASVSSVFQIDGVHTSAFLSCLCGCLLGYRIDCQQPSTEN